MNLVDVLYCVHRCFRRHFEFLGFAKMTIWFYRLLGVDGHISLANNSRSGFTIHASRLLLKQEILDSFLCMDKIESEMMKHRTNLRQMNYCMINM